MADRQDAQRSAERAPGFFATFLCVYNHSLDKLIFFWTLRLPAGFDAATPEPALQLQQAAASRAALQALAGCLAEGPQLIHWPQGLEAPEHLVMEALDGALPPLRDALLPWLQQLSGPLQSADQGRVGVSHRGRPKPHPALIG